MKHILLSTVFFVLLLVPCFAQEKVFCPNIKVVSLNKTYSPGEEMSFSIFSDEELKNLNLGYQWEISKGIIVKGQGTPAVFVSSAGLADLIITATVKIKGLPQNCLNTFSETAIIQKLPVATYISDHSDLNEADVIKDHIKIFYTELNKIPNAKGVIITYGTNKEIAKREALIKKAIKLGKYDLSRIKLIKVKSEPGIRTRFFIVPAGSDMPNP